MSFEIDKRTGCIIKWRVPGFGDLDFLGSGCEFTDWFSFFAHERLGGFGVRFKNIDIGHSNAKVWSKWDVRMKKGHFIGEVIIEEKSPNLLTQSLKLIAQPSSCLLYTSPSPRD